MLLSYIIFLFLLSVLYGFAVLKVKTNTIETFSSVSLSDPLILIPVFIFVFIIGLRDNVGVDYPNYILNIEVVNSEPHSYKDLFASFGLFNETGAQFFYYFILNTGLPYWSLFVFYAFLQIAFFYKAFDSKILFILPFAILFLLMMYLGSVVNIIRQFTALLILFYSLKFIEQRKIVPYMLVCLLGVFIHKSMLLCIPLYFFIHRQFFPSLKKQIIILGIVITLKIFFYEIIFNVFTLLGAYIGYDWYVDNASGFDVVETKSGLGFILIFFLDFILVFFSTRLMKVYKDNRFTIFYNLFFIGLVLKIFFLNIFIFGRSYVYFYSFRFIVMAFLCHYLVFENKTSYPLKLLGIGLLIIQIALFFLTLDKEALAPFQFVW